MVFFSVPQLVWVFTWGLSQVEGFTLFEGGHLVEGLVVFGVFKAVEVNALTVDHEVGQLFGQFDLGFLQRKW